MITVILSHDEVDIVTLEEAMEHSRITDTYDEIVVRMCLEGSHDIIEQYLNRRLTPTTMIGIVGDYRKQVTLPFPPITSISSVTCEDQNEAEVTLVEGTHYRYDPIRQAVRFLNSWNLASMHCEFKITFVCGYADIDSVPRAVKHAIRQTFATLYENREDTVLGLNIQSIPTPSKRLCRAYRVRPI